MNAKSVLLMFFLLFLPLCFFEVLYKGRFINGEEGTLDGPDDENIHRYEHNCAVHRSGRDYSKYPIVLYKNATVWNTHTPRNYYYWIKGLPKVECDIPCVFTWNESMVRNYTDAYFWGTRPENGCDSHSLNFYSTMESPVRFPYEYPQKLRKAGYNILATMELDSDIPIPYLTKKIFEDLRNSKVYPKREDVMMSFFLSNCNAKERLEYLEELIKNNVTYHSFGKCLHNMDVAKVSKLKKNPKGDVIKHYKFYFCFENSVYKDYVTEKVYHALLAGTVPIYYGAPNFADFVPKNSVIDARAFSSPKELAEYIIMLSNNETEYNKYHAWRKDYDKSTSLKMKEIANYDPKSLLCHLCIRVADINRLRYGLEWIPKNKRWVEKPVNPNKPVFLVREYGKYWTEPVTLKARTIEALKKAIVKKLRPGCRGCVVPDIYNKYDRSSKINTTEDVMGLTDYSELEAIILSTSSDGKSHAFETCMAILGIAFVVLLTMMVIMLKVIEDGNIAERKQGRKNQSGYKMNKI